MKLYFLSEKMVRLIASQDRRRLIVEDDRLIDPFGTSLSDFIPGNEISLLESPYNPVIVKTSTGEILFEMRDSNWVYRLQFFPDLPVSQIENYYVVSIPGRLLPSGLIRNLDFTLNNPQVWNDLIDNYPVEVSLYAKNRQPDGTNSFAYRATDGRYYDAISGQLVLEECGIFGEFPLLERVSLYGVEEESRDIITEVDRLGNLINSIGMGESGLIINKYLLRLPNDLIPENNRIALQPSVRNIIFEHRIDVLIEYGGNFDGYEILAHKPNWLFVYGDQSLPFHREENGYVDINGNPFTLPPEAEIREVILDTIPGWSFLIYQLDNNQTVSLGYNNDTIEEIDRIETGPSNGGDEIVRVYPLTIIDERILITIQRRIQNGQTDENLSFFEPTVRINRQVLEELIMRLYDVNGAEPGILAGYSRVSYSVFSQLLRDQQIQDYLVNNIFQPFAGPPGTPNRIIIFTTVDGRQLFTKVQLIGGQFHRPV